LQAVIFMQIAFSFGRRLEN